MELVTVIIISLLLSAFFSGMEIAFVSANKLRIEIERNKGKLYARILSGFIEQPSKFLSTLLLGNNLALVIYGIAMSKLLTPYIEQLLGEYSNPYTVLLIQTVVATVIILITAEFLPKAVFQINPNGILKFFAIPLKIFYIVFYPVIFIFISLSEFLLRTLLREKQTVEKHSFSPVDFDMFLEDLSTDEKEDEAQKDIQLVKNAIDFRDVKIRECAVPRTEIVAVEENDSIETLKEKFITSGFSRILVYKEDIDEIVGYCHALDMFESPARIKDIIRDLDFYPETILAKEVMQEMTQKGRSIAVVVDEWGGTSGIVTIEDIIEEIFGEIEDEFDDESLTEIYDRKKGIYTFSTRLEIDYLNDKYGLDIPESEAYETLGGFIISYAGKIPQQGEIITVEDFEIEILQAGPARLELVNLKKIHNE